MPTTGGPGQQATANPIKAMPVTRATGIAAPAGLSPNNNCPTSDGANQHRRSSDGFDDSGENQYLLHRPRHAASACLPFVALAVLTIKRTVLLRGVTVRLFHRVTPNYPRKQTLALHKSMSAKGQKMG